MLKLNTKLPDLPSQLVRTAMQDLEEAENKSNVKIAMDQWFSYDDWTQEESLFPEICKVCLAGAVMLNHTNEEDLHNYWNEKERSQISPRDFANDHDTYLKLNSLDCFRRGMIDEGLEWLDLKPDKLIDDVDVTHYRTDPDQFKKDMEKVIQRLEDAGY